MDFLAISGCDTSYIIHKVAPRNYRYLVFVYELSVNTPISAKLLNRNCYRLSRVSWAFLENFLFYISLYRQAYPSCGSCSASTHA